MTVSTETNTIKEIVQLHGELEGLLKKSIAAFVRIGKLLTEQKAKLGHGNWGRWVSENLPFTERTASNYLRRHAERDRLKSENVSDLDEAYCLLDSQPSVEMSKAERRRKLEIKSR